MAFYFYLVLIPDFGLCFGERVSVNALSGLPPTIHLKQMVKAAVVCRFKGARRMTRANMNLLF